MFSEEAKQLLSGRGFVEVQLEKLPLVNQLSLFANAQATVAPQEQV